MNKILVKAEKAVKGKIEGTGAGTKYREFTATKISKPFILKNDSFLKMYPYIDVKVGDKVCFVYN